jgi:hypothetical protein
LILLRSTLQALGSLWLAAVLLMVILVAMAYATIYEVARGSQAALFEFYWADWFQLLMLLLAVNILAAMLARFPYTRRQIGFVTAHLSILLILAGAWVTEQLKFDGSVAIQEGKSVDSAFVRYWETLSLEIPATGARSAIDLSTAEFGPVQSLENPDLPPLTGGDVSLEVKRYLPDSTIEEYVLNDNPRPSRAAEVALGLGENEKSTWVFAGKTGKVGPLPIAYRVVTDPAQLDRMLSDSAASQPASKGTVQVEIEDQKFELPIEQCLDDAVPLGETGRSIKVLRYLSHAMVGADNQVSNSPQDRPPNPAIEVEISGSAGKTTQVAFAKFPEFRSMHGVVDDKLKITFVATDAPQSVDLLAPAEIVDGGERGLYVRFRESESRVTRHALTIGQPVKTPWSDITLTVRKCLDRARVHQECVPVDPPRENRTSAFLLTSTSSDNPQEVWIRKNFSTQVRIDGTTCRVQYGDKRMPLGFSIKLNRFNIGRYPGTMRPRSFESYVVFSDPNSGDSPETRISMNNPARFGRYTFYQSSYQERRGGPSTTILSVSWDPGQTIVFVGYVGMVLGMLIVMIQKMFDRRRAALNGRNNGTAARS